MYRLGVALVWLWRATFGALFPTTCKYHPSCSEYEVEPSRDEAGKRKDEAVPSLVRAADTEA